MISKIAPPSNTTMRNLLDNSDFRRPINQRGLSSYTAGYTTIDRWRIWSQGDNSLVTLTVYNGYINIHNAASNNSWALFQRFEKGFLDPSKTYTVVARLMNGEMINGYTIFDDVFDAIQFSSNAAVDHNIVWAAAYEGEFTADTLPTYAPKPYSTELAECRHYYQTGSHYFRYPTAAAIAGTMYSVTTLQNLNMRATPTITTQSPKTPNVQNSLWVANGVENITYTNLGVRYVNGCAVLTFSGISAAYPANAGVEFYWQASAEL